MRKLTKKKITDILRKELPYLKERYGVEKISLFGSFAKKLQKKRSDIDILVELSKPLGLDFIDFAYYLEKKLGRKVDIATFNCYRNSFNNPRCKHICEDISRSLVHIE